MNGPAQLLASSDNWRTLNALQQEYNANPLPLASLGEALRSAGFDPDLAAALTSQLELRDHAKKKFGDSARHMLFTRELLEQATRFQIALLHAHRFLQADIPKVADLGCGLGTESLALSTLGIEVVAVDRNPEAAACTAVNLREFPHSLVLHGDIAQFNATDHGVRGLFLDPARRDARGRKMRPQDWSPSWNVLTDLVRGPLPLGAKLAPGIDHTLLPPAMHTQWLSVRGELTEASMWSPELSPEGPGHSAAVIDDGGLHVLRGALHLAKTGPLDTYLFEADPAVIRSGLLGHLCDELSAHLLHPKIAYATASSISTTPFGRWFTVLDVTSLKVKAIKKALQKFDVGTVEVKKRGADIDPAVLQRQLSGAGKDHLVVFATRIGDQHRAIIASRETVAKED